MFRHSYHPIVITLLSLAALGILVQLFTSPGAFITQILVTIGIVAVILLLMKKFILPRLMRSQSSFPQRQASFQQNQSQKKKKPISFSSKQKEKKKKNVSRPLIKRQSDVKLTVIEGKKNKKKSRALF
ncbi:SA1362 family protein [Salipaludibacillus sp. HK11]|uniref:SA1362 family protein n=1 Tax=Salipaludibacillus sp. HK11 TaxID=3394320 RepID=UPI0039FD0470